MLMQIVLYACHVRIVLLLLLQLQKSADDQKEEAVTAHPANVGFVAPVLVEIFKVSKQQRIVVPADRCPNARTG